MKRIKLILLKLILLIIYRFKYKNRTPWRRFLFCLAPHLDNSNLYRYLYTPQYNAFELELIENGLFYGAFISYYLDRNIHDKLLDYFTMFQWERESSK